MAKKIMVAVSGYFNPLHLGHIGLFGGAKKLGDKLIVIVNNDNQVKIKGSTPFMNAEERSKLIGALRAVDEVIISIDEDSSVCQTLEKLKPNIFANGGDRTAKNIPETDVCKKYGIKMVFGVGGEKSQSSSLLIEKAKKHQLRILKPWGWYQDLWHEDNFHIKIIYLKKGHRISWQSHKKRSEEWIPLTASYRCPLKVIFESGEAVLAGTTNPLITMDLMKGQHVFIRQGAKHRMEAVGEDQKVLEISYGEFDENDLIRYEDDYGRVG